MDIHKFKLWAWPGPASVGPAGGAKGSTLRGVGVAGVWRKCHRSWWFMMPWLVMVISMVNDGDYDSAWWTNRWLTLNSGIGKRSNDSR